MPDRAAGETERVHRIWEKLAPRYDRDIGFFERVFMAGGRQWVCSQAEGHVLEIGVGTGRNFAYYPAGVHLTGVDFSPAMLEFATQRAAQLGREVDLRVGDAQALAFGDASFDTVVFTLSLCSIPDDRQAVREARRVLRPGGRLLLMEHVGSTARPIWAVQKLFDWIAVRTQGDHLVREPLNHLRAEGFEIEGLERRKLGIVERVAARRPL